MNNDINKFIKIIKTGDLDSVKNLIEKGGDIGLALKISSYKGYLDITKYLIEKGADIHLENDYPLRLASIYGHTNIVQLLINEGADIHAKNGQALTWASGCGYIDIVKLLINSGANWKLIRDQPVVIFDMIKTETNNLKKNLVISYLTLKHTISKTIGEKSGIHNQLILKIVYEAQFYNIKPYIYDQDSEIDSNHKSDYPPLILIALANIMKLDFNMYSITSKELCYDIKTKLYSML